MNMATVEFLAISLVLIAICLLLVLIPLWFTKRPALHTRREANIEVYRQRYAEIDKEVAENRLPVAEAEAEKKELGQRLLEEVDTAAQKPDTQTDAFRRPWLLSIPLVILIAGGSVLAYKQFGTPQAIVLKDLPNITAMTRALTSRIQADPSDIRARLMLVRIQQQQGLYKQAAENMAFINQRLVNDDAELLKMEAQNRLAAEEDMSGRLGDVLDQIYELDPDDPRVLWYLGLKEVSADHPEQARDYWQQLLKLDIPDDMRNRVENRLNSLEGQKPSL